MIMTIPAITAMMAIMPIMFLMQVKSFSMNVPSARTLSVERTAAAGRRPTSRRLGDEWNHRSRRRRRSSILLTVTIPEESEPSSSLERKNVKRPKQGRRRRRKDASGDRLRESTGIRPSIHPTVINCISEALLLRSRNNVLLGRRTGNADSKVAIDIGDSNTKPLDIAVTAGDIAASSIRKRNEAAKSGYEGFDDNDDCVGDEDDDDEEDDENTKNGAKNNTDENETTTTSTTDEAFNIQESQLICGRVVGVVMRLRDLEKTLIQRVMAASWVRKYKEEGTFGVLREECDGQKIEKVSLDHILAEKLINDPLIRMNRAECLLALFLTTVERPAMEKISSLGEEVPSAGMSHVDFIDADRLEVLLMNDVLR